eukprot:6188280-Pleurochrysis_carterae.AAC.1
MQIYAKHQWRARGVAPRHLEMSMLLCFSADSHMYGAATGLLLARARRRSSSPSTIPRFNPIAHGDLIHQTRVCFLKNA